MAGNRGRFKVGGVEAGAVFGAGNVNTKTIGRKKLVVTGHRLVDTKLAQLEPKIARRVGRKELRNAVKTVVLPKAKAAAPLDTGALEKSLVVRARKRNRTGIGYVVQTRDGAYKGDQFYGAFHEFGTKHMKADPFLRPAGYSSERAVRAELVKGILAVLRTM